MSSNDTDSVLIQEVTPQDESSSKSDRSKNSWLV